MMRVNAFLKFAEQLPEPRRLLKLSARDNCRIRSSDADVRLCPTLWDMSAPEGSVSSARFRNAASAF